MMVPPGQVDPRDSPENCPQRDELSTPGRRVTESASHAITVSGHSTRDRESGQVAVPGGGTGTRGRLTAPLVRNAPPALRSGLRLTGADTAQWSEHALGCAVHERLPILPERIDQPTCPSRPDVAHGQESVGEVLDAPEPSHRSGGSTSRTSQPSAGSFKDRALMVGRLRKRSMPVRVHPIYVAERDELIALEGAAVERGRSAGTTPPRGPATRWSAG
jgi:hypothetical protein